MKRAWHSSTNIDPSGTRSHTRALHCVGTSSFYLHIKKDDTNGTVNANANVTKHGSAGRAGYYSGRQLDIIAVVVPKSPLLRGPPRGQFYRHILRKNKNKTCLRDAVHGGLDAPCHPLVIEEHLFLSFVFGVWQTSRNSAADTYHFIVSH